MAGVTTVYAYDASGQRVAQATLASGVTPGSATGYVAGGEVTDPNTDAASLADVTATRFYTFGGATVAVRSGAGGFWLLFGDEQGSAQLMMPATIGAGGALAAATPDDAADLKRTAYEPYGARRGVEDLEEINRGWIGQVEDAGTGLTYLNARYYDPTIGRFLSPDPLMDPGDPRTLDPYRYADNNPVVFSDASGLAPSCSGLVPGTTAYTNCNNYSKNTYNYATGLTVQKHNLKKNSTIKVKAVVRAHHEIKAASQAKALSEGSLICSAASCLGPINWARGMWDANVMGTIDLINLGSRSLASSPHQDQFEASPKLGVYGDPGLYHSSYSVGEWTLIVTGLAGLLRKGLTRTATGTATREAAEDAATFSATETWGNVATLDDHFARHGSDFAATSADDYAAQASQFFQRSQAEGLPTKVDSDGVFRVFEPSTNTFGSYNPDGTTRTFFKPSSPTYWERQPGSPPAS